MLGPQTLIASSCIHTGLTRPFSIFLSFPLPLTWQAVAPVAGLRGWATRAPVEAGRGGAGDVGGLTVAAGEPGGAVTSVGAGGVDTRPLVLTHRGGGSTLVSVIEAAGTQVACRTGTAELALGQRAAGASVSTGSW